MTLFNKYKISIFIAWYDFWIGIFVDTKKNIVYICLLPCIVIKIEINIK